MYYTYDTQGNILRKAIKFLEDDNMIEYPYIYSEDSDKLIEFDGEALEYDEIGNPTLYRCMSLTWVRGRMLSEMDDGGNRIEFTYDAHGIRNTKKTSDYTVTYHYENGKLLREETSEADVITKTIDYLYGAEGIIGIIINGDRYLFRKNIFGDVTHIYNANGVLVGKYSYTAFGCTTIDLDVDGIATENPIRYRSYYCDFETGLYYLKSRYYDPDFGRFLNVDDISYLNPDAINGLNMYAYCGNNPVMYVDPQGTNAYLFTIYGNGGLPVVGHSILIVECQDRWLFVQFRGGEEGFFGKTDAYVEMKEYEFGNSIEDIMSMNFPNVADSIIKGVRGELFSGYSVTEVTSNFSNYTAEELGVTINCIKSNYDCHYNFLFNNCCHLAQEILRIGETSNIAILASGFVPFSCIPSWYSYVVEKVESVGAIMSRIYTTGNNLISTIKMQGENLWNWLKGIF